MIPVQLFKHSISLPVFGGCAHSHTNSYTHHTMTTLIVVCRPLWCVLLSAVERARIYEQQAARMQCDTVAALSGNNAVSRRPHTHTPAMTTGYYCVVCGRMRSLLVSCRVAYVLHEWVILSLGARVASVSALSSPHAFQCGCGRIT